jgi:hypothetical protein
MKAACIDLSVSEDLYKNCKDFVGDRMRDKGY